MSTTGVGLWESVMFVTGHVSTDIWPVALPTKARKICLEIENRMGTCGVSRPGTLHCFQMDCRTVGRTAADRHFIS